MMLADIKIADGERKDTREAFGLIYLKSDKLLDAPVRAYEATSYAEEAGEHLDPRTVKSAFDFKITFCTESIDPRTSVRRTSTLIKELNEALFSRKAGSDIITARKVTIYDYPRNRVIVGYPKPISEPEDDEYFISRGHEFAVVSLNLRVANPNECDFDWAESINKSLAWYGIEYDATATSPACTRIGNMDMHRTLPIQSKMRGCLLDDDGNVVKYLNPQDWTSETLDGSMGQVMVEIAAHYRRFETDGNMRRVKLSEYPLPGFHYVPKSYVSALEATVQRSTNTLCSVVNSSADYRGGTNNGAWDNTYRSLLGRPATNISRTNFRAYARKRKPATSEWNCLTYDVHKTICWLFVIEYATRNSQATYNPELTSEGYRQGGIGAGVTTLTNAAWENFNIFNPFIPCGYTNSLGNGTGVVAYDMPVEYRDPILTVSVPRYRGIENPFGHITKWVDGVNVRISPTTDNGGDNLSKAFVCHSPRKFNDDGYSGYRYVGNIDRQTNIVIAEVIFGEGGELLPLSCIDLDSGKFFTDIYRTTIRTTEKLTGIKIGSPATDSPYAGLFAMSSGALPTSADSSAGTRLCFIPEI